MFLFSTFYEYCLLNFCSEMDIDTSFSDNVNDEYLNERKPQ